MATPTDFGRLSTAQKKVWLAELWQAGRDESFWFSKGFIGKSDTDMNSPISRITKLTETERGMECVMSLVQDMQGDGTVGDNKLEDNEEQLFNETISIKIDQLRHGVRSKGEMAEQATVIRFRETAKGKLQFWLPDKLDELMFLTVSGRSYTLNTNGSTRSSSQLSQLSFAADVVADTSNRRVYAGSATAESDVTTTDKFSWSTIVAAKSKAIRKKIRPIRDGGKGYFVIVMSPEQERDLVLDPTYQTIVSRAAEKGSQNPLFTGALAVVQGVILYSHNKVFNTLGTGTKWGSGNTIDGAQALLLGAQAGGLATLGNMFMRESDNTDYGNRPGIGIGRKIGMLKPQFKSLPDSSSLEDFGVISIRSAAAA
jgi:N4-gp56 family major capsid protein